MIIQWRKVRTVWVRASRSVTWLFLLLALIGKAFPAAADECYCIIHSFSEQLLKQCSQIGQEETVRIFRCTLNAEGKKSIPIRITYGNDGVPLDNGGWMLISSGEGVCHICEYEENELSDTDHIRNDSIPKVE